MNPLKRTLSTRQVANRWAVKSSKVIALIRAGELEAFNVAIQDVARLFGESIAVRESFIVGGHPAPYPGHWSLPAQERANCRCTHLGAFAG
jgi:hypothetical protein